MNRIIVFSKPNFQGESRQFSTHVEDLLKTDFGSIIGSAKVCGQPWMAYEEPYMMLFVKVLEEGEYPNLSQMKIKSIRIIPDDLENPSLTLFENTNFQGKRVVLTNETILAHVGFDNKTSSHYVSRGAWLLYMNADMKGRVLLARSGEINCDYKSCDFNETLSLVVPLKPGKPALSLP
ncbi:epidermal differentiation-specific protein-like [Rhinatrema bivittatum]|uniref:epidermal differentiation-specific protein-like n=1 Tax=Rhinatrema bivittatum TaxID=194408 RepID=UPI0011265294|nr:epidermal differentiation-specific protein-like [Rhinatrema bivittatum]